MALERLLFEVTGGLWEATIVTMFYALIMLLFAFLMQLELVDGKYVSWVLVYTQRVELKKGEYISYIPFAKVVAPLMIFVAWAVESWQILSVVFHFSPGNLPVVLILVLFWTLFYILFNLVIYELLRKKRLRDELNKLG